MEPECNSKGELMANTMILDDGSVIFIDEHHMTKYEIMYLDNSIKYVDEIEEKYGTLDIFKLMDRNITKSEMFKLLCAIHTMDKHGLID
jgi:hypothetical protein